jgi:hypothetical protein
MQIGAIHHIRDREAWDTVFFGFDPAKLPEGVSLVSSVTSSDVTTAMCIWEAPEVGQMQAFLDEQFGDSAENRVFALEPTRSMGLPVEAAAGS